MKATSCQRQTITRNIYHLETLLESAMTLQLLEACYYFTQDLNRFGQAFGFLFD